MSEETLPPQFIEELQKVCDAFDHAWEDGRSPRIIDYLGDRTEPARSVLFQMLLRRHVEHRRRAGEMPSVQDYLQKDEYIPFSQMLRTEFGEADPLERTRTIPPAATEPGPSGAGPDHQQTTEHAAQATPVPSIRLGHRPMPERIGAYRVVRLLGEGNFQVYLAIEDSTGRKVAIKIARPSDPIGKRRLMSLAHEAVKLQALDHPRIVKLLRFVAPEASNPDHDGYIVLEYIEGQTLEAEFRIGRIPAPRLIRIIADVAEAVHHAHTHASGIVHRDLKPSNILIDKEGEAHVCDFGLAIDEEVQKLRRGEIAGTLSYMAPEQVRGETHRLDGRTDLWALGVILYRGLTGRMPFPGRIPEEIFEEILQRDPKPPRMIDPQIDPRLERICLRCVSRAMADRYLTAADLAADLRGLIAPERAEAPTRGPDVPYLFKGLRSFDDDDARFFLELVPGPRRGDGMPESVHFWKDRIQAAGGEKAISTGILFGPSGGGKSSFVKAALIPQLDAARVLPLLVETTPLGTEPRIEAALRRAYPELPDTISLPDALALVRENAGWAGGKKLCLILDQFEQWLQAHPDHPDAELVRALRQCDGTRITSLILVRDDFWMALTRFLKALDVPLAVGRNAAAVELFDFQHTRKVLEGFGHALGRLPGPDEPANPACAAFLEAAVRGLTDAEGRVVPMRLSLFTEVVRNRPWTPETLEQLGGVEGIGVKFLDDCFARAEYKAYRTGAQAVLKALLPPPTSMIRGKPRSERQLQAAVGARNGGEDFAALLRVLAQELRLITPADGEGADASAAQEPHYQLAHDSLVRSIRQWLEREQHATRKGRARLRLELITASWLARPGSGRLPSLVELATILWHVPARERTAEERRMIRAAERKHLVRAAAFLGLIAAIAAGAKAWNDRVQAGSLLAAALQADFRNLPRLIPDLDRYRSGLVPELERLERGVDPSGGVPGDHKREVAGILLFRYAPTPGRGRALRALLREEPDPDKFACIASALREHPEHVGVEYLQELVSAPDMTDATRLRAVCMLLQLDPPGDRAVGAPAVLAGLRRALLAEDRRLIPRWVEQLGASAALLVPGFQEQCGAAGLSPAERLHHAEILGEMLVSRQDAAGLARSIAGAQPDAARFLRGQLKRLDRLEEARAVLLEIAAGGSGAGETEGDTDARAARRAEAVITLAELDQPAPRRFTTQSNTLAITRAMMAGYDQPEPLLSCLKHQPDPRLRTRLIVGLARSGLELGRLIGWLAWGELDSAQRQAVLLALAEASDERGETRLRERVVAIARRLYAEDGDPGVHSAAELVLRRWGEESLPDLAAGSRQPADWSTAERGWEIGPNGHTLIYLRGPLEFRMGSPEGESGRFAYETQHERRIERSILAATTETTLAQYRGFRKEHAQEERYGQREDSAVGVVSWYDAIRYCNWLSRQAGLEPFFPEEVKPGTQLPMGGEDRGGFRLPTEAEWEYLARGQTTTSRWFGETEAYLERHAWTWLNSGERMARAGALLPNSLGMFDMLGGQWEWTLDGPTGGDYYPGYPAGTREEPAGDAFRDVPVNGSDWRIVRGGCFDERPSMARSAHRDIFGAGHSRYYCGFRVVRTVRTGSEDGGGGRGGSAAPDR
jgi:serine/threonine protein kinase/formylglycine-generating enzyme required for sulfatase activity